MKTKQQTIKLTSIALLMSSLLLGCNQREKAQQPDFSTAKQQNQQANTDSTTDEDTSVPSDTDTPSNI